MVSIYIHHAEYIALSASLKKLKPLKALPLVYSTFLQGMIFSGFSRYLLPAERLRIKLERLKADYSMKIQ
ncbi:hypothetical protein [Bacteroides faecium]|uniref:Uncharacterized protein n=1 Tax=Bacteroides faecium TaxID=2715212 RepID=A0A6H0KLR7_9BACE|nr:hypothetical protein [Bacteroides faecium]QIU94386.1 hypothetical protein BacF7301_09605 [Bacteroides faecium]